MSIREAAKKNSFFNGRVIKREGIVGLDVDVQKGLNFFLDSRKIPTGHLTTINVKSAKLAIKMVTSSNYLVRIYGVYLLKY